ncbi:uncharacterized protein LOC125778147 [Bactrocera dorsalis]|uniref:Uncharacterized protein LOC125778147 n=1 Tax=Bactrocera dorsalis TaxID=27457 RepID=A0ABM3JN67_BACDO|nr:uncharacterized protein LOC125778147 [Bactrocera dorsalis]
MEQQNNRTKNNKQTTATTIATTTATTTTATETTTTTTGATGRSSSSTASKSGPGARRKASFMDALSPEERALFEEHARDDDDVPSGSGTQRSESGKTTVNRANAAPSTPLRRIDCREEGGFTKVESKGERKRRRQRGNIPRTPEPGQPGGHGDPRRAGMSGATLKWYLRFLEDGKTPESAEKRALSRSSGNNPSPSNAQRTGANGGSAATRRRNRRRRQAHAASLEGRSEARTAPQEAPRMEKRKSGQITPQEPPRPKRVREDKPQETSGRRSNPNQQPTASRKYAEAVSSIRMAVLPRNYPRRP